MLAYERSGLGEVYLPTHRLRLQQRCYPKIYPFTLCLPCSRAEFAGEMDGQADDDGGDGVAGAGSNEVSRYQITAGDFGG